MTLGIHVVDAGVMEFLQQFSQKSAAFNALVIRYMDVPTLKMLPLVCAIWLLWFGRPASERKRVFLLEGIVAVLATIGVSRLLQALGPERHRPIYANGISGFLPPIGMRPSPLEDWSSFPSDHAAVVFAISTVCWRVSRPIGALCYLWSAFVVCLPRLYAGYHYATDVLAGALLGVLAVVLLTRVRSIDLAANRFLKWTEERYAGLFYAAAFALSYQIVVLFDDLRRLARELMSLLA